MVSKKFLGFRFTEEGEHIVELQRGATILSVVADHQSSITVHIMIDEFPLLKGSYTYTFKVLVWSDQPFDSEGYTFLGTVVVKEITFFKGKVYHVFYKKK